MYGLTLINQNMIIEKAKTKKNGCYLFRGVAYKVVDNKVEFFVSYGKVVQTCYGFNSEIGTYEHTGSDSALKFLKRMKV